MSSRRISKGRQNMKRMRRSILVTTAGLALMLSAGVLIGPDTETRGQLTASDYKFVKNAARGGTSEVELGELAAQKASNDSVRQFGQRMVTDHKRANVELRAIASRKGATLPAEL